MVLKVVGLQEYLDEGEVMDYVYVRKCLKQGKDITLALVPNPNLELPPLPSPPAPVPAPAPPPQPETLNVWDLSPHAKLRVRLVSVSPALRSSLAPSSHPLVLSRISPAAHSPRN